MFSKNTILSATTVVLLGKALAEQAAFEQVAGTIGYIPINAGWQGVPFGPVNSTTSLGVNSYCPGVFNLTDLYCSGDQFDIYIDGVFMGNTSQPVNNSCLTNITDAGIAQANANYSHGSYPLLAGFHNITIMPIEVVNNTQTLAVRYDTVSSSPCTATVCPITKGDLVVVNTKVPRCQAESVCNSLGLHLAHVDITNFLDATTLAYQCGGAFSQAWVDDWNGDSYAGSCLALSTGGAAPGGAINVPSCCNAHLPVICQKKHHVHPTVQYNCNSCQTSCYCSTSNNCQICISGTCTPTLSCGAMIPLYY